MTARRKTVDLSMMTHVPVQPHWLAYLPAFQSGDARLVRASINMLMAAFHGQPAGTLPKTVEAIATVTHLTVDEVKEHFPTLVAGWKTTQEAICFEPMAQMAARLATEYGDALRRLQDGVSVAIAAPDLFNTELLPDQGAALESKVTGKTLLKAQDLLGKTAAKRLLPDGAQITPDIRDILMGRHFTADTHDEIWQLFVDYHQSKGTRSANWTAEFRNWLSNKTFYGRLSPDNPSASLPARKPVHRFQFTPGNNSNLPSRAEAAHSQASESLDKAQRAVERMRQNSVATSGQREA